MEETNNVPANLEKPKGKKGGKRPGAGRKKASHTITAEAARAKLIELAANEIGPIALVLIKKAKEGDMAAIKELFSRVLGQPLQPVQMSGELMNKNVDLSDDQFARIIRERAEAPGGAESGA